MKNWKENNHLESGVDQNFWREFVVKNVRRMKGNKCQECNFTENLDVHHVSYEVQTIETLKLLCRKCHKGEHKK